MIERSDEGLEESPGPSGDPAKEPGLIRGEGRGAPGEGAGDPPGEEGRGQPQRENRRGGDESVGAVSEQSDDHGRGQDGPDPHGSQRTGQAAVAALAVGVARGLPFEQPARDEQAPAGAHDGVEAEPGLVGQAGEVEAGARGGPGDRAQGFSRVLTHLSALRPAQQVEHRGQDQRSEQNAEDGEGPQPRRREKDPGRDDQRRQSGGHEAPAQIVGELPLREQGEGIPDSRSSLLSRTGGADGHPPEEPRSQLPVAADPAMPSAHIRAITRGEVFIQMDV